MNSEEEARDKLGSVVLGARRSEWKQGVVDIMEAADAYGDARELRGHVEACRRTTRAKLFMPGNYYSRNCGDGWYCDNAPRRP